MSAKSVGTGRGAAPLTPKEFAGALRSGVSGGFLFYGDEAYTKHHALKTLRSSVLADPDDAFNHIRLDARDEAPINIDDAIESLPVFAERKLVELHGFDIAHMKADELKALAASLELLEYNPHTVLVAVTTPYEFDPGRTPAKPSSKEYNALCPPLVPVHFAREGRSPLIKWALAHFSSEDITASAEDMSRLIDRVGNDMFTLSGEITKLCAYLNQIGRKTLRTADIEDITVQNMTVGPFDFSNAICKRDGRRALRILEDMKQRGEAPEKILFQISGTLCELQSLRAYYEEGADYRTAASALGMNEYRAKINYPDAAAFGEKRLLRAIALCDEADFKIKFTALDKYTVLSRLICEML